MAQNWYKVLELEPDLELTENDIKVRIEEKNKEWARKATGTDEQKFLMYRSMVDDIRRDMLDTSRRKEMYEEAVLDIDNWIKRAAKNNKISEDQAQKLASRMKVSERVIHQRIKACGVNIESLDEYREIYDKYTEMKRDYHRFADFAGHLYTCRKKDLYDFLGALPKSGLEELRSKTKEIKNSVRGRTDAGSTSGDKLCLQSDFIFRDETNRAKYDEYLKYSKIKKILGEISEFGHIGVEVQAGDRKSFIEELTSCFDGDADEAEKLFDACCKINKIRVSSAVSSGSAPPKPSPSSTGTPAPSQSEEQFKLGERYEKGDGLEKNLNKAFEQYEKAAAQGHAAAQYKLGYMYSYGQGVGKNIEKAVRWYAGSASQGFAEAQFNLGYMYHFNKTIKDISKALEWYAKAAAQGHVKAQIALEQLKSSQQETSPPKPKTTTSDSGGPTDPAEQCKLGFMYENGFRVVQDYAKAVEWYRKAAEQGEAQAQKNLGFMYEAGRGVEKNLTKAVEWYEKAAAQGHAGAKIALEQLKSSQQETPPPKPKPTTSGSGGPTDPKEQNRLGDKYYDEQDYANAVEWYRKAAEQGNDMAQCNLGWMYQNGFDVEQDYAKAVEWYLKAAAQGVDWAQNKVGFMYENGFGVELDYPKAFEWYRKAAEQGNAQAQCILGGMYKKGQGVLKNLTKAAEWYKKAAEQGHAGAKKALERLR